jgi:pyridoxal phosphate enzyme (YggS family)
VIRSRDLVLQNLAQVRARIAVAASAVDRDPDSVTLVAVGKTVEAAALGWVVAAGVRDLGENYVRELRDKAGKVDGARWHFIGTLQASGAHHVAGIADIVQTLVPGRAATRLAARAVQAGRTIPVLVEIDLASRGTGVGPRDAAGACDEVARLDGLELRGLMTVPPVLENAEAARPFFRQLRELRDGVAERHPEAIELSMGMSLDYQVAVGEGATMVRIGTALFGARPPA